MKKRTVLSLIISLILVIATVTGCSGSGDNSESTKETPSDSSNDSNSSSSNAEITLTLYGNAEDIEKPYMQTIFDLYEEETGSTLDIVGIDQDNFENVALTKFQTGDIPDLFMHFGGYGLDAFNPQENFVDFSDAEWVSDIEDMVLSQTKRDGIIYGLPYWEASISGCVYNKKIFDESGIDVPTTQDEFYEVCQTLLDNDVQPVYMAVKDQWPILYQYALDPVFADTELLNQLNSNQTTYAEIPELTDMCEFYKKMAENGYLGEMYATDTWDYASEVIGTGEAAMMFVWDTWLYTDYDSESYEYTADDFGMMPAFMGTTENGTFEGPNCSLMLANKNGDNVEAAIEFINFMADPGNYNIGFEGIKTAPVFKGQNTIETTPQYEEIEQLFEEIGNNSIAYQEIIGFTQVEGAKSIQELLIGNITVEECLKLMDEDRIKTASSQQVEGF